MNSFFISNHMRLKHIRSYKLNGFTQSFRSALSKALIAAIAHKATQTATKIENQNITSLPFIFYKFYVNHYA